MPSLHNVPIGFSNQAFIVVSQEEIVYQDGNDLEDLKFEDCLSWEELSTLATNCPYKCIPVISQSYYEGQLDRPRCKNGSDQSCMSNVLWQVFVLILSCSQHICRKINTQSIFSHDLLPIFTLLVC